MDSLAAGAGWQLPATRSHGSLQFQGVLVSSRNCTMPNPDTPGRSLKPRRKRDFMAWQMRSMEHTSGGLGYGLEPADWRSNEALDGLPTRKSQLALGIPSPLAHQPTHKPWSIPCVGFRRSEVQSPCWTLQTLEAHVCQTAAALMRRSVSLDRSNIVRK